MLFSCLLAAFLFIPTCHTQPGVSPAPLEITAPPIIIMGFVGGFIRPDNPTRGEVQLAERLRKEYAGGAVVETYASHDGDRALGRILALLDTNHDGVLSPAEKQGARILLYGHSWGASAIVTLARRLDKDGVPVLLTVQLDSVAQPGQDDRVIPGNVEEAVNLYQTDGFVHGKSSIQAADSAHTRILGNFQLHYDGDAYRCVGYSWYARLFTKAHTQLECDPKVWDQVHEFIQSALDLGSQNLSQ